MSHGRVQGRVSGRGGLESLLIFFNTVFIFDLRSKIFGVKLISPVFLCPFHAEETW